jgi:hypothetical protein
VAIALTGGLISLSDGAWGVTAIRLPGPLAGACLLTGVGLYFLFRPQTD